MRSRKLLKAAGGIVLSLLLIGTILSVTTDPNDIKWTWSVHPYRDRPLEFRVDYLLGKFVRGIDSFDSPSPDEVESLVGPRDLPYLHTLLSETRDVERAEHVIFLAAIIGFSDDSAPVLIDYADRTLDDFDSNAGPWGHFLLSKSAVLPRLGRMANPDGRDLLRELFTKDGANAFASKFMETAPPEQQKRYGSDLWYILDVRRQSAIGLIFTERPKNIALIEAEYNAVRKMLESVATDPTLTTPEELEYARAWFYQLVELMAYKDILERYGSGTLHELLYTRQGGPSIEAHMKKYKVQFE